ncbi:MAG: hypothetical protein WC346_01135 [Methanogenium sp.]|jgi:hypothetical protein
MPFFEINGKEVKLYGITEFAKLLGKTKESLLHLEKIGVIPKTPLRSRGKTQKRLYCFQQLEGIIDAIAKFRSKYPQKRYPEKYYNYILNEWKKIDIFSGLKDEDFT